jgi:hypothetical protein
MGSPPSGGGGIVSAPVPTPAPPVTDTNKAVLQAQQDVAQQNLLQKSVKNTILAGDTGGFVPGAKNVAGEASPITAYKTKLG